MTDVFHEGEHEIQARVGETHIADHLKGLIAGAIPKGASNFVEKQPMAIVGSRNVTGELWASLLIGNFRFIKIPEPSTIIFDTTQITSNKADVFFSNILQHDQIGSLFIEFDARRRLRVNGSTRYDGSLIILTVKQAYPNCPKYIQRRIITLPEYFEPVTSTMTEGHALTAAFIDWIKNADTMFVASAGADGNLDASHRGGNAGFVEVIEDNTLKIPDYPGNSLYNTFGNIAQNPNVGVLFIDFEKKQTLQLTGTASLLFDQTTEADLLKTKGTGRYWLFNTLRWIHTADQHNVQWKFLEYSPFNP